MLLLPFSDLPGNAHDLAPGSRTRVARSRSYRVSWLDVVSPGEPRYGDLAGAFPAGFLPAGEFGAAGLESQEHCVVWAGDAGVIAAAIADPAHRLPEAELAARGSWGSQWPGGAWLDRIPATTWCPGGQGIVADYDFAGARVVVYETPGRPALVPGGIGCAPAGPQPVVTFHCTSCHLADERDHRYLSSGPGARQAACQAARRHMQPGQCEGPRGAARAGQMAAAVMRAARGTPAPGDPAALYAAHCQTRQPSRDITATSSCAEVREARTHAARHAPGRKQQ
jgi:hypothetical protein